MDAGPPRQRAILSAQRPRASAHSIRRRSPLERTRGGVMRWGLRSRLRNFFAFPQVESPGERMVRVSADQCLSIKVFGDDERTGIGTIHGTRGDLVHRVPRLFRRCRPQPRQRCSGTSAPSPRQKTSSAPLRRWILFRGESGRASRDSRRSLSGWTAFCRAIPR